MTSRRRGRRGPSVGLEAAESQLGEVGRRVLAGEDEAGQQPRHLLHQGLAQDQTHVLP